MLLESYEIGSSPTMPRIEKQHDLFRTIACEPHHRLAAPLDQHSSDNAG